jgi:hypothetical protein
MNNEVRIGEHETYVLYSCHECGAKDVRVAVAKRTAQQNVIEWLDDVRQVVANNHSLNFHCSSQVCDLKIPIPKDALKDERNTHDTRP